MSTVVGPATLEEWKRTAEYRADRVERLKELISRKDQKVAKLEGKNLLLERQVRDLGLEVDRLKRRLAEKESR